MEFLKQNMMLIAMAVGTGIALLWPMLNRSAKHAVAVSASEAVMLMSRQRPLVLDVREADAFAQGHLQGARHIPLNQLETQLQALQKYRDKPVLVYCESGARGRKACAMLGAQQFTQLYQLQGGLQAWREAKLPLSQ